MAGSELGQCGVAWAWEQDLRWVNVRGLGVEDKVRFLGWSEMDSWMKRVWRRIWFSYTSLGDDVIDQERGGLALESGLESVLLGPGS